MRRSPKDVDSETNHDTKGIQFSNVCGSQRKRMTTGTDSLRVRFRWTPALCGLIAILIGATGLTGWLLNVDVLKRLHPALSSMKANSAMGLELAGLALLLATARTAPPWRRRVAWVCATFVTLLGLLTLGEYIFAADLRIDELLVRDLTSATLPGRMGANTAACFLLIGVALLLLNVRWRVLERLAEGFALAAFVVALAALLGFAYDASVLRRLVSATEMSLHSALSFVLLCVGLLAPRPCRPFVAMLLSPGRSGVLLRMVPMTVPLFLLLGWLRLMGERAGLYDTAFGVGLFVLASIILMNLLIWRAAWNIDRLDTARKAAEEAERAIDAHLRVTLRSIGDAVISLDVAGNVTFMNAAAENVSGWTQAEAQGCPLTEVLHTDGHTRAQVDEFAVKGIHNGFSDGLDNYMIVVARDGRETPVDYSFAPIRDEGHNLAGAVLVLRDTTERKHAEEARENLNTFSITRAGRSRWRMRRAARWKWSIPLSPQCTATRWKS